MQKMSNTRCFVMRISVGFVGAKSTFIAGLIEDDFQGL